MASTEITGFRIAPVQEQIWSEQKGSACFRTECAVRVGFPVTADQLAEAAAQLVARYEILRTRYHAGDGRRFPLQVVLESGGALLERGARPLPLVEKGIETLTAETATPLYVALTELSGNESRIRLSLPAMAGDSATLLLLAEELVAGLRGETDEEEALQYTQYAEWSRQFVEEPEEEAGEFWRSVREQRTGRPELSRHRSSDSFAVATLPVPLDAAANALRPLAEKLSISVGDLLTGLWGGFLLRLGNGKSLEIGCDLHGREFEELAGVIGPIARTVPCILDDEKSGNGSTANFLKAVAERLEEIREVSDYYPFDEIEERRNRSAAVEIMEAHATSGFTLESLRSVKSAFTLKLSCLILPDRRIFAELFYNTSLLDADSTAVIAEMFGSFVRNVVAEPDRPLRDYPLLDADRLETLHKLWNASGEEEESGASEDVLTLIERAAAQRPDAVGVVEGERQFTYADLMRRAAAVARTLSARGIGRGDIVPFSLERSFDAVGVILGIMKIGAAFLPIDPALPDARRTFMAQDSGARIVITTEERGEVFGDVVPTLFLSEIESEAEPDTESASSFATTTVDPDDAAYVIYTSGSTGTPKGCIIRRRNIAAYVGWALEYYFANSAAEGHWPLFTSLSFDLTLTSIFCALARGGSVTIFGEEKEMPQILREIFSADTPIDIVKMTPAQASLLAGTGLKRTNVRGVILGGEQLQSGQVEALRRLNPEIGIFNEYGPTETTIGCVTARIEEGDERITIGTPIRGACVYVADQAGELCAPYEVGELWIAGTGVGAGYLNRPELTAERFRDDLPFTNGATAYRTGDLVRRYPDGQLEYLGRNDDQVKVRGYRVELGEIRRALLNLEGVADGIVLARSAEEASSAESELIAWYVPAGEAGAERLREQLHDTLPDYMIPQFLVPVESIPLTVNGKPDTAALPDPRAVQPESEFVSPRTETERLIAEVWSSVLGQERVGIHDDFFRLGGHSLRAMRGIAQVNTALGSDLKVGAIFEHPTVAGLAKLAEQQISAGKEEKKRERIERIEDREHYELSDAQRRLWVLEQMEDIGDAYHVAGAYDVRGEFDPNAFAKAFGTLVERHEILRTTFPVIDGTPMQRIREKGSASIEFVDLQSEADAGKAADTYARDVMAAPFNLEAGPLIRAAILRTGSSRYRLLIWMHHIVSDGWSVGIMVKELVALYRSYTEGLSPNLPPLEIQYRDFADYQERGLRDGALSESRTYWLNKLSGAAPLDLPLDIPRPGRKSYRGNVERFAFDGQTLAGLEKLATENGASLFMVLTALLNALLHRYTGQEDIIVGTAIAGRDRTELEDQIGFYVNVLPLRTNVQGQASFADLLAGVRRTATEAYAHQSYPFDRLVDELGVERETGRSPLFDVFLVLQNNERETLRFGDAILTEQPPASTPNKYDISFDFSEEADGLHCEVNYNTDVFLPERIRNLVVHLRTLTQAVLAGSANDAPISSLAMLTEEEMEAITRKGEESEELCALVDRTIPDLVDEIAFRYPERRAVSCNGRDISYATLRRHSNGVAALLGERVNTDTTGQPRIAILLPRDERIPLLFLAILKAGGTYVPIDPAYPAERIERMLKDCSASLLITDAEGVQRLADISLDDAPIPAILIEELLEAEEREERPLPDGNPGDVAAILYTSGSTGQPKGVRMHHCGLINAGLATTGSITLPPPSLNILQFASLSFDAYLCETLSAFTHGHSLVIVPREVIDDPLSFADFIERNSIRFAILPPAYLATLNKHPLPSLQTIITAGEPPVVDDALFYAGTRIYINAYGPTECSICVAEHSVSVDGDYRLGVPIGSELPNIRLLVLDRYGNPLPAGFDGEICVVGKGVGPGYLNEEQTRASFIGHPLFPGERMYKTGDLGRRLFNGEILFRGRLDNQVKVRGHRVEPEEIASVLQEHLALSDAAVVAQKPAGESVRLIAWVVAAPSAKAAPAMTEIRSWLAERLPAYMIPSFFLAVEELPTTPNGKVDRAKLLADAAERIGRQETTEQGREPVTGEEHVLTEAVADVLGLSTVSPDDNYFMLGGDSIKAIRLTWGLRERGYELQVRDIFAHPVLADAATRLRRNAGSVEEGKVEGGIPLTPIQRWFFANSTAEGRNRFNQSVLLKKEEGRIDEGKVRAALGLLLEWHDMLRASFDTGTESPDQFVAGSVAAAVELSDLIEAKEPEVTFREELTRTHASIDIAGPSLLKAKIIRTDGADYLHLVAHHLVVDLVSWHILAQDLTAAYRGLEEGMEIDSVASLLPPRTKSYRTWSERLNALAGTEEAEVAANFWRSLATDAARGATVPVNDAAANTYGKAVSLSVALDAENTAELLGDVHSAYNTDVRDVVTAALGAALRNETGGGTCVVALEGHGRSVEAMKDVDVSRTVGWFTALYPVTLDEKGDRGQTIKQTKEMLRALPMEGMSYGLCRYLSPEADAIPDLLTGPTQVVLNYLGVEGKEARGEFFTVESEPEGIGFAPEEERPFEIEIIAAVRDGKFQATFTWGEERVERERIERVAEGWIAEIGAMIAHALAVESPELTPSDVDYDGLSIDDLDDILSNITG